MTKNNGAAGKARPDTLLSPIRTLTVGPGVTPGLLTFKPGGLKRSRAFGMTPIYRRWGITPRPENKPAYYNADKKPGQRTKCAFSLAFFCFAYFWFILSDYRITLKETLPPPGSRYD